ncbi:MAG: hypothetical protein WCG25_04645 [bacterium]
MIIPGYFIYSLAAAYPFHKLYQINSKIIGCTRDVGITYAKKRP